MKRDPVELAEALEKRGAATEFSTGDPLSLEAAQALRDMAGASKEIDQLDAALCQFLNNVGDEYDPRVWLPSVKRDIAALSKAYNDCHRAGIMDIRRAALSPKGGEYG